MALVWTVGLPTSVTTALPPALPPPRPCSNHHGVQCTCRCCSEGVCPNYFFTHYPATLMANTGSSSACTARICRRLYPSACPVQGGEVAVGFYEPENCPPAPPQPPPPPCASGGITSQCACQCCSNNQCQSMTVHRVPLQREQGCTPTLCTDTVSECILGGSGDRARVIASPETLLPCGAQQMGAASPTAPPAPTSATTDQPLPVWVMVLVPVLVVFLVAAAAAIFGMVHQERKGTVTRCPLQRALMCTRTLPLRLSRASIPIPNSPACYA
eukprot:762702-Prymnesium_polylepis.1